ncbi:DNA (cytosine-5)-methyltransferase CMT2 [Apostasia shenzhenica]|uniref:DNA (cytosine-5-)-methyltransferase n=1 Tax=Apostasia shenzhenica TaxID=1088818 RepID=A0A2I0BF15_9ASPA|nr:DNA (cytosine-5)-methyltransferase CMT2 [Apostasia shenzhenica]
MAAESLNPSPHSAGRGANGEGGRSGSLASNVSRFLPRRSPRNVATSAALSNGELKLSPCGTVRRSPRFSENYAGSDKKRTGGVSEPRSSKKAKAGSRLNKNKKDSFLGSHKLRGVNGSTFASYCGVGSESRRSGEISPGDQPVVDGAAQPSPSTAASLTTEASEEKRSTRASDLLLYEIKKAGSVSMKDDNDSFPSSNELEDITRSTFASYGGDRKSSRSGEISSGTTPVMDGDGAGFQKQKSSGTVDPLLSQKLKFVYCFRNRNRDSFSSSKEPEEANESTFFEEVNGSTSFVGEPVPDEEARRRWPHHYVQQGAKRIRWNSDSIFDDEDEMILNVKCHFLQANISGFVFSLGDCAYVKGEEGKPNYIGRILEFFVTTKGENYFTVQWFYRAEDTVMKNQAGCHDKKRLFYSNLRNDNLLDCIVSKVRVMQVPPSVEPTYKCPPSYFYYDMKYSIEYSTFQTLEVDDSGENIDFSSSICSEKLEMMPFFKQNCRSYKSKKAELSLLDLYSGCGGMSTGLCLGAKAAGVNLVTKWAVDFDEPACQSLKINHPEILVRNEKADDFLELLKEWNKLCDQYASNIGESRNLDSGVSQFEDSKLNTSNGRSSKEYEVLKLVDICYGDPASSGEHGLKFKVRWKGYNSSEDTWEPLEHLSNCKERIKDFIREGSLSKRLPRPGDVDVICGGPPCQGISGYNRFRNFDAPLDDERNRQVVVFMDIVRFLKPKYVLMENVVDILKFAKATLGRYALSRLVEMNYQARLGIMAAGCYGLPQFRLRAFLWGCHPEEKLPQFPLPTHETILKGGAPAEFEPNLVAYDECQPRTLKKAVVLEDALSDLPPVTNVEDREEMPYNGVPQTDFQRYIRMQKFEVEDLGSATSTVAVLYDHRPLPLGEDDYLRVCQVPKRKGANFRDLPGVIVGADNTARIDPSVERKLLPSGRLLVPDFAISHWNGKSARCFARLWWDEIVPTVLTVPDSHCQVCFCLSKWSANYILHKLMKPVNFSRLYYIPSKIESLQFVRARGCKDFLISIGYVGK